MKRISLDEKGFFHPFETPLSDTSLGQKLLLGLEKCPHHRGYQSQTEEGLFLIEAFDQPYVIQSVVIQPMTTQSTVTQPVATQPSTITSTLTGILPYGVSIPLSLESLCVDEWDRFLGVTEDKKIPYVLSPQAQNDLFNLCDYFNDEGLSFHGVFYSIPSWSETSKVTLPTADSSFWNAQYEKTNPSPGWDLGTYHPSLPHLLSQLKLSKSRILILGCGKGHDGAFLARQGHLVTLVDFSEEALKQGQKLYQDIPGLEWVCGDILDPKLPVKNGVYDIILEHTCFCAIPIHHRQDLVRLWLQKLKPGGHLMGLFFSFWQTHQPPYGSTEWEIRKRLTHHFKPLYWQRLHTPLTPDSRKGSEFFVYATTLSSQ
jgi:SAM-dependent methyltransferase